MNIRNLRFVLPVAIIVLLGIGLMLNFGTGTLSAFGWGDLSLLCPLGALTSMLAGKTAVPRAVFALVLVVAVILVTGRAFCSWICPVPVVQKLRDAFKPKAKGAQPAGGAEKMKETARMEVAGVEEAADGTKTVLPVAGSEAADSRCGTERGCAACKKRLGRVDSRHIILGGTLLSAAVFGFPVFCLICPVGLTFGTILLVIALFGHGDVTWSVVLIPALLLVEVVFFRKWCSHICPMGAFLSLVAKGNRTLHPVIDETKCLETTKGAQCGRCTLSCEQGINLRDGSLGASRSECTRCLACIEACPTKAISIAPALPARRASRGAAASASEETLGLDGPAAGEGGE